MRWAVLLLSCMLATTAVAAPTRRATRRAELTREFQAGVDAFRLGKLDVARQRLEKARALDPSLAGPHRFLAAVARAQGRYEECVAAARRALVANPRSRELAATRALHEDCRTAGGRAPYKGELADSAAIAVECNVGGAIVTIGGLVYGATPLAPRVLMPGTFSIVVAKPGWKPAHVVIDVIPGVVTDVAIELVAQQSDPSVPRPHPRR